MVFALNNVSIFLTIVIKNLISKLIAVQIYDFFSVHSNRSYVDVGKYNNVLLDSIQLAMGVEM